MLAESVTIASSSSVTSSAAGLSAGTLGAGEHLFEYVPQVAGAWWIALIPLLALIGSAIALGMCYFPSRGRRSDGTVERGTGGKNKAPALVVFALLSVAFVITLVGYLGWWNSGAGAGGGDPGSAADARAPQQVTLLEWIRFDYADENAAEAGEMISTGAGERMVRVAEDGSVTRSFIADIAFYMDGLSWLWMLFVTFLGAMICLYASEYMHKDAGYPRFFAAFGLFVTSMACLVMGDNLVLLYLGWEGVGLCSYLLIGYYYKKPSAVAAAKKAFIVNRIGDLGLALGLYLTYTTFGTVQYDELFRLVDQGVDAWGRDVTETWVAWAIPLLLMVGAFGKSAQFPLYVWLPDAMEGPTPVSALIHAATMVTAGVYLIARMYPLFLLDPDLHALHAVAWIGTFTALLAATIGMAQFDIKRIMAYSTVSQLGYMFAGLGFLTSYGAAYHVFTHAFFKATLFLACGAVMHGFAGQLDLRKLSGLWTQKGWFIVSFAMLIGCLNLAGFAFTAGYFSKDMILAEAFYTPDSLIHGSSLMGWLLLLTAGMTAYYTFRVFFRVFVGPEHFEPGDEHHEDDHGDATDALEPSEDHVAEHEAAAEAEHAPDPHSDVHAADAHGHGHGGFHPHPPGWAINTVMIVLAVGSILAAIPYFVGGDKDAHAKGWVGEMLASSSAEYFSGVVHPSHADGNGEDAAGLVGVEAIERDAEMVVLPAMAAEPVPGEAAHGTTLEAGSILGGDPHKLMYYISSVFGIVGILIAAYLHGPRGAAGLFIGNRTEASRSRADGLLRIKPIGTVSKWAQAKWYVDELYNAVLVLPLLVLSHIFHAIDKLIVDGALVEGVGFIPRALGSGVRPSQSGLLQGYALSMAGGIGFILLIVWLVSL